MKNLGGRSTGRTFLDIAVQEAGKHVYIYLYTKTSGPSISHANIKGFHIQKLWLLLRKTSLVFDGLSAGGTSDSKFGGLYAHPSKRHVGIYDLYHLL